MTESHITSETFNTHPQRHILIAAQEKALLMSSNGIYTRQDTFAGLELRGIHRTIDHILGTKSTNRPGCYWTTLRDRMVFEQWAMEHLNHVHKKRG